MSNMILNYELGESSIIHLDSDRTDCRILGHDFNQLYGQALSLESKITKNTSFDFNDLYGLSMRDSPSSTKNNKSIFFLQITKQQYLIFLLRAKNRQWRFFEYKVDHE